MSDILETVNIDMEELLEDLRLYWLENELSKYNPSALSKVLPKGRNIMCCCPYHTETNPSMGILSEYPFTWNCFGCGANGNLAQLVQHTLGMPNEVLAESWIVKNYSMVSATERPPINIEEILDGTDLDRKRTLPESEVNKYKGKKHEYMSKRGFTDRTLIKYEVGFDEEVRAITFPVRTSDGRARFIKRRFVDRKGFLNEKDIYKKDIVYGLNYIVQAPNPITEIYLNESETDTMACYQGRLPAGAILGRILFKEQVKELVKAGIKTVNLFLDNDIHGVSATLKANKLLSISTPIRVNVVRYPWVQWGIDTVDEDEVLYKDANDLLKSGRMKDIEVMTVDEFIDKLSLEAIEKVTELDNNKNKNK